MKKAEYYLRQIDFDDIYNSVNKIIKESQSDVIDEIIKSLEDEYPSGITITGKYLINKIKKLKSKI